MLAYQRVNGPTVRSRVFPMFVVKSHWSRLHPSTPKHFKCCFVYQWGCIWNMPSRYLKSDILYSNKQTDAQAHTHIYIILSYIYLYHTIYKIWPRFITSDSCELRTKSKFQLLPWKTKLPAPKDTKTSSWTQVPKHTQNFMVGCHFSRQIAVLMVLYPSFHAIVLNLYGIFTHIRASICTGVLAWMLWNYVSFQCKVGEADEWPCDYIVIIASLGGEDGHQLVIQVGGNLFNGKLVNQWFLSIICFWKIHFMWFSHGCPRQRPEYYGNSMVCLGSKFWKTTISVNWFPESRYIYE